MDAKALNDFTADLWDREITPALFDYIRIPAKSPAFDADWAKSGFIDQAVEHMAGWAREKIKALPGATLEVVRLDGRTPVILIESPGEGDDTVLLYGHLDKQPEMTGWRDGLGPWTPVLEGDKLYGRGGADDGYALFASLAALLALTAVTVTYQKKLIALARSRDPMEPQGWVVGLTVLLGAVIGVAVSISSVGAGAIGVTALLMLYPRLPIARIVGSDIAHAVPLTFIAGAGHWYIGDVNGVLLSNLLVGSIPGVIVGSLIATRARDSVLRPLLAMVLAVSAWQLFVKANTPDKADKPKPVAGAPAETPKSHSKAHSKRP